MTTVCRLLVAMAIGSLTHAQQRPTLSVCEDTSVTVGQTKQQVREALSVCCSFKTVELSGTEYPNQMLFSSKQQGGSECTGSLLFGSDEKLVFAYREVGQFNEHVDSVSFVQLLTKAVNRLFPSTSVPVKVEPNGTTRVAPSNIELSVLSGPAGSQKTIFVTVGDRTLRIELDDYAKDTSVFVREEIGDMRKYDAKSLAGKK
jgi:hypothetical protein